MTIAADYAPPRPVAEPKGIMIGVMVFVLAMANFLAILDITIVNVIVPNIAGSLAVSTSDGTWVITAYAVAEAIMVPLTGWIADRFGPVRVFTTCIFAFGIVSILCGLSTSLGMLIFFRVLLGVVGGPMIPLSQTLLLRIIPQRYQVVSLAVWSMMSILAPVVGPALGGYIADNWNWAWAFHFKIALALPLAMVAWLTLSQYEIPNKKLGVDFGGLWLLVLWMAALQIMLGNGQDWDWFNSDKTVVPFIIAAIGFLSFLIWETTDKQPIVNLRVYKDRTFAICMVVVALAYGSLFAAVVVAPQWMVCCMGYTTTLAGVNAATAGITSGLFAPIATWAITKYDHRAVVMCGLISCGLSCLIRVFYYQDVTFMQLVLPQLLQGASFSLIMIPLMDMSLATLPEELIAAGAGQMNFVRTLAGAIATAVVIADWDSKIKWARATLVNEMHNPAAQFLFGALQNEGVPEDKARSLIDLGVQMQAAQIGTEHTFLGLTITLFVCAGLVWIAPKPTLAGKNNRPPMH